MKRNLLIIGAGIYGLVAKEIAESTGRFDKISFIDDLAKTAFNGDTVIAKFSEIRSLSGEYTSVAVAIGNPDVRLSMLESIKNNTDMEVVSLVSPRAYVSPSASVSDGCIIEPMAVVHAGCVISRGCIISAGAVVNHASVCGEGVHVDCNATVAGNVTVPSKTKVISGDLFNDIER